jgi:hypothetical protein
MNDIFSELFEIVNELDRSTIDYALCGGLAVAIYGYVRFTKDIDLIILPKDLEKTKSVLATINYDLSSGIIPFKRDDGTFQQISRISKAEGKELMILDLLLCSGPLTKVWDDREQIDIDGKIIKVVSKKGLITMKKEANRPQDLVDIQKIVAHDD